MVDLGLPVLRDDFNRVDDNHPPSGWVAVDYPEYGRGAIVSNQLTGEQGIGFSVLAWPHAFDPPCALIWTIGALASAQTDWDLVWATALGGPATDVYVSFFDVSEWGYDYYPGAFSMGTGGHIDGPHWTPGEQVAVVYTGASVEGWRTGVPGGEWTNFITRSVAPLGAPVYPLITVHEGDAFDDFKAGSFESQVATPIAVGVPSADSGVRARASRRCKKKFPGKEKAKKRKKCIKKAKKLAV